MDDNGQKPIVLVVDDVPENIDVLAGVIVHDYEIRVALNGKDALAIASTPPFPDLILLDIMMPDMDGYEVCRQLKAGKHTNDIPVIFVTAMSEVEDERKGFSLGAVDYITKPINPYIVKARVNAQISLKQYKNHLEELVRARTLELRQAMKSLKTAKETAEGASRAKSQFLTNVSHELKTPMAGILTSAELLATYDLEGEVMDVIEMVIDSGNSLHELIDNMLRFSESEQMTLSAVPFRIDELLGQLKTSFFQKGVKKSIKLNFDISDELMPNAVIGDFDRLKEVFNNLLDNAVKFSEDPAIVTIGMRVMEKSSSEATIEIYVKDNGIGIAPAHFQKIFEPFTQVDASQTRQYDGAGIGLSVCRQILSAMEGKIRVESKLGSGSTFYFTVAFKRQNNEHPFTVPVLNENTESQTQPSAEPEVSVNANIKTPAPLMDKLAAALKEMNPEEIKTYLYQMKTHMDKSKLTVLTDQINEYRYEEALLTLKEISKTNS